MGFIIGCGRSVFRCADTMRWAVDFEQSTSAITSLGSDRGTGRAIRAQDEREALGIDYADSEIERNVHWTLISTRSFLLRTT